MDMGMIGLKAELILVGVLASSKKNECSVKLHDAMINSHSNAETIVAGLNEESLRGYIAGLMTAINAISGGDALESFHEYSDGLDEASRKTLERNFRDEVEHYSATGES